MFAENILLKKGVRNDALWTNFLYRDLFKRIPLALDTRALLQSQYWPREKIKNLQDKKIKALLQKASGMPFWDQRIKKAGLHTSACTAHDLAAFPVTSKEDFRGADMSDYTDPELMQSSFLGHTSGSTGVPFAFYHDRHYELRSYAFVERLFRVMGNGVRVPVISMRNRDRQGFAFKDYYFFHLRGSYGVRHRLPELQKLITSLHGDVILFCFSSSLIELVRLIQEKGLRLPFRGIIASGEELSDARRNEIEKTLNTKVFVLYSAGELGRLGFECEHRRLHLNEEWAFFETVDDDRNLLPPGSNGRIVVTVFENFVMPFIRYDVGDRGTIVEEHCPCGRHLRTLQLEGRALEKIRFADGREISLLDISSRFDRAVTAIYQFQIVRTGEYEFLIRVIPGPDFENTRELLEESIAPILHPRACISWEMTDSLSCKPSGKALYFVDTTVT